MDEVTCAVCGRPGARGLDPDGSLWSREVIHEPDGDLVENFCADAVRCMSVALRLPRTQV